MSPGDLVIAMLARSFPAATHRVIVRQTCRVCQYSIWCRSRTHDSPTVSGVAHARMTRLYLVSSVDRGICSRVQDARHRAHQFGRFSNTTRILSICRHVSQRLANAKPVVVCHVWLRKQARELFVSEGHGARCLNDARACRHPPAVCPAQYSGTPSSAAVLHEKNRQCADPCSQVPHLHPKGGAGLGPVPNFFSREKAIEIAYLGSRFSLVWCLFKPLQLSHFLELRHLHTRGRRRQPHACQHLAAGAWLRQRRVSR